MQGMFLCLGVGLQKAAFSIKENIGRNVQIATKKRVAGNHPLNEVERETGFEPATSTLARLHSTTELFPLMREEK